MRTFSSEIQRPSAAKLWQSPAVTQLPIPPRGAARETPDDVQAASYLAASDRISSFSIRSTCMPPFIEHMFFFSLSWSTVLVKPVPAAVFSAPKRYNWFTARKFGNIIVNQDCMPGKASPNGGFQAGGCLKNQNSRLFLQTAANAVLKSLGILKDSCVFCLVFACCLRKIRQFLYFLNKLQRQ